MSTSALEILGLGTDSSCTPSIDGAVNIAVVEMQNIYQERLPYTTVLLLDGTAYLWGEAFITNCLTSMATDNLVSMTAEERRVWYAYVDWSNHNTHSADLLLEPLAIGCTIPDIITGLSYAVLPDGTITTTLCNDPLWDIAKPDLYKSLDDVFVSILNCQPYNLAGADTGSLYSVTTCPVII